MRSRCSPSGPPPSSTGSRSPTPNRADVIGVCRALDGIPLAIELAAVRLRALPLDEMARRLDDRFRVLTGGKRAGLARHQTLRAAIEWSYGLCTPTEQLVWAGCRSSPGAFDLAAAAAVCAGGELTRREVVVSLIALAEKSVLVTEPTAVPGPEADGGRGGRAARYRMLDTLREFGAERLAEHRRRGGRGPTPARRALPRPGAALGRRPMQDQLPQYRALCREHANLRAAVDYALGLRGNDSAAIGIATSLMLYWRLSGRLREGEYWLNRVLERCPRPSPARARVLAVRGYVTALLGDLRAARADAEAAVAMAVAFGDMAACGRAYVTLHRTLAWSGNLAEAEELADDRGCPASARSATRSAWPRSTSRPPCCTCRRPARIWPSSAAPRASPGCPPTSTGPPACCWPGRGSAICCAANSTTGTIAARRGLALEYELGDMGGTAYALGTLGFLAAAQGRHERAALLFGGSAPLWERIGPWYTGTPALVALHRIAERAAQDGLGEERYWQLRERGAATPLDQIIRFALADVDDLAADPGTCGRTDPRTESRRLNAGA